MTEQLVEAPPPPPNPSAPARPEIEFEWTTFSHSGRDLLALMALHWEERSSWKEMSPLDVDWNKVFLMEDAGTLQVLVAREQGRVIAYVPIILMPHVMAKELLFGYIDTYVVHPAYRDGWLIMKMLKRAIKHMEHLGVKVISARDPDNELHAVFKRLGFGAPETTVFKVLDK